MASVSTTPRKLVPQQTPGPVAVHLPERTSFSEELREQAILFARRRMLDWKIQSTRVIVVLGGSALVFSAWKSLMAWLG
jgi:hypothetical protein